MAVVCIIILDTIGIKCNTIGGRTCRGRNFRAHIVDVSPIRDNVDTDGAVVVGEVEGSSCLSVGSVCLFFESDTFDGCIGIGVEVVGECDSRVAVDDVGADESCYPTTLPRNRRSMIETIGNCHIRTIVTVSFISAFANDATGTYATVTCSCYGGSTGTADNIGCSVKGSRHDATHRISTLYTDAAGHMAVLDGCLIFHSIRDTGNDASNGRIAARIDEGTVVERKVTDGCFLDGGEKCQPFSFRCLPAVTEIYATDGVALPIENTAERIAVSVTTDRNVVVGDVGV